MRVLVALGYFSCLVSCLINRCLFCNCLLTSIFDHCLLAYGFSHSTAHPRKTTRLVWGKAATSSSSHIVRAHHHTTAKSTPSKSSSEKVVFICEAHLSHLAEISEWISTSFLLLLSHVPHISHAMIHLTVHLHTASEAHLPKVSERLVLRRITWKYRRRSSCWNYGNSNSRNDDR